ncbi:MAG TPA: hypothetical protein VK186_14200 [Candidatus Deferrimicrobium sp.]|nr:hypothetical protein [Candidatus Deferrimicrobium sp.]
MHASEQKNQELRTSRLYTNTAKLSRVFVYRENPELETSGAAVFNHITSHYLDGNGSLDIKKIFLGYQAFMKEQ